MTETVPGVIVGGLGITRRVVLSNKEDITFQVAIDSTADKHDLFGLLDNISAAADRERLKAELAEKKHAHAIALEQPAMLDKEIARLRRDRAATLAGFHARHAASQKRSEYRPSERDQQGLDQFEAQIQAAQESKKSFARDLPIIEWEIARLEALIAGQEVPARPAEVELALSEAAD